MKNLYKSLAKFQQECPVIHKSSEGYGYSYTSLANIYKIIMPLLQKHGLGFTQGMEGYDLTTTIFHCETGENIKYHATLAQNVTLAKMNAYQVAGSAITYFRRYELSSALGIVTDKDMDMTGVMTTVLITEAEGKKVEELIESTKTDKAKFLTYMNVRTIQEIESQNLLIAMNALRAKERK